MKIRIFYFLMLHAILFSARLLAQENMRPCLSCGGGGGGGGIPSGGCPTTSTTLYVDGTSGNDSKNGKTPANAMKTLGEALNFANQCDKISAIKVTGGVYKPTTTGDRNHNFYIGNALSIQGGYSAGFTAQNPSLNPTILDGNIGTSGVGDNSHHVVVIAGVAGNVTLDGIQIRNGNANGSGHADLYDDAIMDRADGAGMYIFDVSGSVNLRNCVISGNSGNRFGGGIFSKETDIILKNVILSGNSAAFGDGLYNSVNSTSTIISSMIFGGSPMISGEAIYGSGVTATTILINSIVGGYTHSIEGAGPHTASYSIVKDGHAGTGNFSYDPQFSNAADPNGTDNKWMTDDDGLKPTVCGPGINKGDAALMNLAEDIAGEPRVFDALIDIGPYEYQATQRFNLISNDQDYVESYIYGGNNPLSRACRLLVDVTPAGANPVSGAIAAGTVIKTDPVYDGEAYVERYYDIRPRTNQKTATGIVTLYFEQGNFDQYNTAVGTKQDQLPKNPSDAIGKANLKINHFFWGDHQPLRTTIADGPEAYDGGSEVIDPKDVDIDWVTGRGDNYWRVTFPVKGFGGFFVTAGNANALPVKLVSFHAYLENNMALLNWETTLESESSHFEIQRGFDAKTFETIGRIEAAGNATRKTGYRFDDPLSGIDQNTEHLYYRLKMVDLDSTFAFSKTVTVRFFDQLVQEKIVLLGNPVRGDARIRFHKCVEGDIEILIVDRTGKVRVKKKMLNMSCSDEITVPTDGLGNGFYVLRIMQKMREDVVKMVKM